MMSPWLTATQIAPGPVLGLERGVAAAYGGHGPRLHRPHRLAAGERGRGRLGLDRRPELLLGEVAQRPALPLAVVALGDPAVVARSSSGPPCAPRIAFAVCRQRSSGLLTIAVERQTAQPLRGTGRLAVPRLVELHAGEPAGQHTRRVRGGAAVADEDHGCHVGERSGASLGA